MKTQMDQQELKQQYLSDFRELEQQVSNHEPVWLHEIRKEAIQRFDEMGFPHNKQEEWRFTNIKPLLSQSFARSSQAGDFPVELQDRYLVSKLDSHRLVFINGVYVPERSEIDELPEGVVVCHLAEAISQHGDLLEPHFARLGTYDDKPFAALNTGLMLDGAFVYVPKGVQIDKPIQVLYLTNTEGGESLVTHPRTLIVAGPMAEFTVIENFAGVPGQQYWTNAVTEIIGGENCRAHVVKFQRESEEAYHVSNTQSLLSRDAHVTHHNIIFGGQLVRNDIDAVLNGENVECVLNGLYMGRDGQLIDNHTNLMHEKPHCNSWEMYKGILDDQSQGIFKGKIFVQKDAQITDAKQTSQGLLLSEKAGLHAMPQLEIYADDVKCTHGATTGRLDEKALFYARSRGLSAKAARFLLTYAFASEIIEQVPSEPLQEELHQLLLERLPFEA